MDLVGWKQARILLYVAPDRDPIPTAALNLLPPRPIIKSNQPRT